MPSAVCVVFKETMIDWWYLVKSGEKILYSRCIPSEICKELPPSDRVGEFLDFVTKYALFDDVIDWERDVKDYGKKKQVESQRRQI